MEIKVGEYVRTNQGYIAKLEDIDKEFMYFDNVIMCYYEETKLLPINEEMLDGTFLKAEDYIVKHSFNIIDLIEEGDILKIKDIPYAAEYISEVFEDYENNLCVSDFEVAEIRPIRKYVDENKIKIIAILTKEQFKAMEYEVK